MLQIDMIRNGLFGQDYGMKLFLTLIAITLYFFPASHQKASNR